MPLVRKETEQDCSPVEMGRDEIELALLTGDASARRAALSAVGKGSDFVPILSDALETEDDPATIELIFTRLARIGTSDAVDAMVPLLASENALLRNKAVETMMTMGAVVVPAISKVIQDPDVDVRIQAVAVIAELPVKDAQALLTRLITKDDNVNVCACAVEAIIELGGEHFTEQLEALAARFPNEPSLGFAIEMALAPSKANH